MGKIKCSREYNELDFLDVASIMRFLKEMLELCLFICKAAPSLGGGFFRWCKCKDRKVLFPQLVMLAWLPAGARAFKSWATRLMMGWAAIAKFNGRLNTLR